MKIDRLLSMVIYLVNRELVSARELSEKFGVSVRTIQRDIESIEMAGIPIMSIQGPSGGYGIMDSYKMDRNLMSLDDLYFIITALKGIGSSLEDSRIDSTLEKMTGLVSPADSRDIRKKSEKLHIDFSMLGGSEEQRKVLGLVQQAVDSERLLRFSYTNNQLESTERTIEPMTIVFKWRAWYLFGYCRLKQDYRIFRASKIHSPEILPKGFIRRDKSYADFDQETISNMTQGEIDMRLRFSKEMKPLVDDYYSESDIEYQDDDCSVVNIRMPENGWLYGYILSFGQFVEVLEPPHLRAIIKNGAEKIADLYNGE